MLFQIKNSVLPSVQFIAIAQPETNNLTNKYQSQDYQLQFNPVLQVHH
jgi:hypothetical protein